MESEREGERRAGRQGEREREGGEGEREGGDGEGSVYRSSRHRVNRLKSLNTVRTPAS